jgi:GNAT superfamily N-acetyltransferase
VDIAIRNLIRSDIPIADDIFCSAFKQPASHAGDIERYLVLQPDGLFLAIFDGAVAGMGGAIDYGAFAYIGMMAVHPAFQRRGIGHALMRHLLAWLDARGTPMSLLDASAAGAPIYARLGFVECDKACTFQRRDGSRSTHCPDNVRLVRPQDLPALCAFDRPIFGADRSCMFRALLGDSAERVFLIHDEAGQLAGYVFARPARLGPWVVRRPQDAYALLQAALSLPYKAGPTVIVPKMNSVAQELVEQSGFQRESQPHHTHMRRGGAGLPGQRALIYGQTSFSLG